MYYIVCTVPTSLNFDFLALGIAQVALSVTPETLSNFDPYNLVFTLNISFSIATTVLSTLLITIRILMTGNIMNTSAQKRYRKPIEIIIESSAIYSSLLLLKSRLSWWIQTGWMRPTLTQMLLPRPWRSDLPKLYTHAKFKFQIGYRSDSHYATSINGEGSSRPWMDT